MSSSVSSDAQWGRPRQGRTPLRATTAPPVTHDSLTVVTASPAETKAVAAALAPELLPGDTISLSGDLGAGKTVFVQGLASGLGVTEPVTSPTFTIVHEYDGHYPVLHLDVYRLGSFQEVIDLGFDELSDPTAILVVEWGEAVAPLLPPKHLAVEIRLAGPSVDGPGERLLTFGPRGGQWPGRLEHMRRRAEELLASQGGSVPGETRWAVASRHPGREDEGGIDLNRET